ncbi:hypothetical protein C8R45DRAFT_948293 [Mycena sanguinolenta]|nr:hypothetical protein C8R45DRAFT_948293 [Mycena sanguinolenta]
MPRQPTMTKIRLENLADCLAPTITILNELDDAFGPPFVQAISKTIASLLNLIQVLSFPVEKILATHQIYQTVKRNKKECAQLREAVHQVLYAIINLHIKSEAAGSLAPTVTETLHKIYAYVEAQQDGNKIKQLFCNIDMNNLLKD